MKLISVKPEVDFKVWGKAQAETDYIISSLYLNNPFSSAILRNLRIFARLMDEV